MFKNLKMSAKLYLSTGLLLSLLLAVGIIGWLALERASHGFVDFRAIARDTALLGELRALVFNADAHMKNYILNRSVKDLDEYREHEEELKGLFQKASDTFDNPEWRAALDGVRGISQAGREDFGRIVELLAKQADLADNRLAAQGREMEEILVMVADTARRDFNLEVALETGLPLRQMLLARVYSLKFLEDASPAAAERVEKELAAYEDSLKSLGRKVSSEERKKAVDRSQALAGEYRAGFMELTATVRELAQATAGLDAKAKEMDLALESLGAAMARECEELGPRLEAGNEWAISAILLVAGAAFLLGLGATAVGVRKIVAPIREAISGLLGAAHQVGHAAQEITGSSESLAQGASEQASSLEETSASMEQMSGMTRNNAENARQADLLMSETKGIVTQANASMKDLRRAMEEITSASDETSRIIRTIDDIAFQTNLLALNAAVEAARAGEAGAGFAVVADEVRNLALRAAEAARQTQDLIEKNVRNIANGSRLVKSTDEAFSLVENSAGRVAELVGEISAASSEQAQGIDQVNRAINEMDKVTQQNAAGAEESAAAAQELTVQSGNMLAHVDRLMNLVGSGRAGEAGRVGEGEAFHSAAPAIRVPAASRRKSPAKAGPAKLIPLDEAEGEDFQDFRV